MAVFKVARERQDFGEVCKYKDKKDLDNLIYYCGRKSKYIEPVNIQLFGYKAIVSQFIYIQNCSGKRLNTRAHHFILSFNTEKYERFVQRDIIGIIMGFIGREFFAEHQAVLYLHTNTRSHYHVHIIVNPVSFMNYKLFRYDIKDMQRRIAIILKDYHIALQGVSYYDTDGYFRYGDESGLGLYQPLLGKKFYF